MENVKHFIKDFCIEHKWEIIFGVIFAAFFAFLIEIILKPFRHWKERRKALKGYYTFTGKSSKLTPDKVWEGIRLGKYNKYYYPRPKQDSLINDCLKSKKNVLIIGPPLSGKTRTAYQVLIRLNKPQKVAVPICTDIKTEDFRLPKPPIIFINDLHEFVDKQNFERLWNTATDVKNNVTIIATCQSAEMKKVGDKIKDLRGIFEEKSIIELPIISEAKAKEIANKVEIDWNEVEFDGTIGSVFLCLDEMRKRFNKCAHPQKVILQALRSLYICGIYEEKQVFPLKWIKIATKKVELEGTVHQWNAWLDGLRDKGFITFAGGDRVRAEETHLKVVVEPPGTGEILDFSEDTIAAFSDDTEALFWLGNRAETIGNVEIAIEAYTRAIKINPRFVEAFYNRGVAYGKKDDYDRAILAFNEAIEIHPRFAVAFYNRGVAYGEKDDYDRAILDYNDAIKINPRYAEAFNNRGTAYGKKDDYDRAILDYNEAIEINPGDAEAFNNRGVAYGKKDDYDRAILDYNEAIEINPGYAEAFINRGNAYDSKDDYDRAILDYNEALEINPRYAEAFNNRGIAYYSNQEYDKAWDDVHSAQGLGYQVHPGFLKDLREASGRE